MYYLIGVTENDGIKYYSKTLDTGKRFEYMACDILLKHYEPDVVNWILRLNSNGRGFEFIHPEPKHLNADLFRDAVGQIYKRLKQGA